MIAHDQVENTEPRADLIRFKSLGESLAKSYADVVLITLNDKGRYEKGDYRGLKVYKVPLLSRIKMIQLIVFSMCLLPALFRARAGQRFDIVFLNSIFSIPAAVLFRFLSGGGFLQFDLMGILSDEKFLLKRKNFWTKIGKKICSLLENFLLSRMGFITTINDRHKQIIESRVRRPVYVIRDGVHEGLLRQSANLREGEKDTGKILIIFVGQLNHFRLDALLRVMTDLVVESPSIHLQILGSGPQLDRYRRMTSRLGLKGNVSFEGYVPHEKIFDYIARADIAYSDDWSINGFPMKIYEYMALEKPVVAEGTESIRELLKDGENALLYENEGELREKILILAQDGELRRRIGENGRQTVKGHLWERRGAELYSVYRRHVESNGRL